MSNRTIAHTNYSWIETIASALGEPITLITPVVGKGEANEVFLLRTRSEPYILRTHHSANTLRTYKKEAWCIEQTKKIGVPGANVVGLGTADFGAYVIQSYIPGIHGEDWSKNKSFIWKALGQYAALTNSISVKGYGEDLKDPDQGDFVNSWDGILDWSFDYLFETDFFEQHGIMSAVEIKRASARLRELYEWKFEPRLNHGNLAPKNTIVREDRSVFLLDWGTASAHRSPHLELSEILTWWESKPEYINAFLEGYGLSHSELKTIRHDVDTLILLRALDSIRWANENKSDWQTVDFIGQCRRLLPTLLGKL